MSRKRIYTVLFSLISVGMSALFLIGVVRFFTVPPKAKKEAEEIEIMLRKNQEEAEKKRQQASIEAANRKLEERAQAQPVGKYSQYKDASEMHIIGIGDSVMLAAIDQLYQKFPNGYFDAVFGRTIYEGKAVVYQLEESNQLGDAVVYSLGTNSYIDEADVEELIQHSGGRPTFWLTTFGVSNDSNEKMQAVVERHNNAYMIDWETFATANMSTFILPDGLHPNEVGSVAYAEYICGIINRNLFRKPVKENHPIILEQ